MVDEIPKLSPELFTLGGVEKIKRVRPRPDDSKEQASEAEDEGLLAEREQVLKGKSKREGSIYRERIANAKKKAVTQPEKTAQKDKKKAQDGETDVQHVDIKA